MMARKSDTSSVKNVGVASNDGLYSFFGFELLTIRLGKGIIKMKLFLEDEDKDITLPVTRKST